VKAEFKKIEVRPPQPPVIIPENKKKPLQHIVPCVYGNLDFPENIDFAFPHSATSSGADNYQMSRIFLVETAEYYTTKATQYTQVMV
jgi:hypothetical protein